LESVPPGSGLVGSFVERGFANPGLLQLIGEKLCPVINAIIEFGEDFYDIHASNEKQISPSDLCPSKKAILDFLATQADGTTREEINLNCPHYSENTIKKAWLMYKQCAIVLP
jgi:hypothetical protein